MITPYTLGIEPTYSTDNVVSCIIGASGYTGAELTNLLANSNKYRISGLYVSENSDVVNKKFSDVYRKNQDEIPLPFKPLNEKALDEIIETNQAIFLCTSHKVSAQIIAQISEKVDLVKKNYRRKNSKTKNLRIYDLSGAFRLKNAELYPAHYGFEHPCPDLLKHTAYGLVEWNTPGIKRSNIIAVPGCYPTASTLGLMPLIATQLLDLSFKPIINAVSGISGAGKTPSATNSFCELSLQPYSLFSHRHLPEINQQLGAEVVFTPHISNFDRGILATIYCQIKKDTSEQEIKSAFLKSYKDSSNVRLVKHYPSINNVKYTPYCDIYWQKDPDSEQLIVVTAIDNLLKGAASQALECAEIHRNDNEY
ncbi:MAG: N-acetyl-gamma-glutamyl-phosphate reductase [Pseudomonadota bacterium]